MAKKEDQAEDSMKLSINQRFERHEPVEGPLKKSQYIFDCYRSIEQEKGGHVAKVLVQQAIGEPQYGNGYYVPYPQGEANCDLFVAAPDLLAACEAALDFAERELERREESRMGPEYEREAGELIDRLKEVLESAVPSK